MAYIFKSIAATQFLWNLLFMYFLVNCDIFKFHNCCSMYKWVMATLLLLLVKMWKITNILQTVRDRAISSKFLAHRVVQEYPMLRGKRFGELWPTFEWVIALLKMSKCELSLKVLQIANFSQITHSPTFGRAFTWWSFRPVANYSPTQNE